MSNFMSLLSTDDLKIQNNISKKFRCTFYVITIVLVEWTP
jgi:hypothetical protein